MAAPPAWSLPPDSVFKPSGHLIVAHYLVPKALEGETVPGLVADGVDVFSAPSPAALPFHPASRRELGEAWGYYYGAYPAGDLGPVPGGCWARYGPEKRYTLPQGGGTEVVAFRRRFAFRVTWRAEDGRVVVVPTPWLMKEYRLNKGALGFRAAAARARFYPGANMDCVVRKIFVKPPPPPPACSSEESRVSSYSAVDEEGGYSSDEDLKRLGCRIEKEPARKRGRFCVV